MSEDNFTMPSSAVKEALETGDDSSHDVEMVSLQDDVEDDGASSSVTTDQTMPTAKVEIANKETRHVFYTRALVVMVLMAVATTISTTVFFYSRDVEEDTFEYNFQDIGEKVIAEFKGGAHRRLSAMQSLAHQFTSFALSNPNVQWPNVALPDFERRAQYTMGLSDVLSIIFFPIVTIDNRSAWETFSVDNQQWLKEGLQVQGIPPQEYNQEWIDILEKTWGQTPDLQIRGDIFRVNGTDSQDETGPGPYAPWWQFAPAFPTACLVNYNGFSHPTRRAAMQSVVDNKQPLVTASWDYSDENSAVTVGKKAAMNLFLQHGGNEGRYGGGPASDIYVPIFDNYEDRKVVGELGAYVYWQVYFENILPQRDVGVYAVLQNSCNQSYTYRIDGSQASYEGPGDLHDTHYSNAGVHTDWGSFIKNDGTDNLISLDDEEAQGGRCLYKLSVYPSDDLEDVFMSKSPAWFAVIVAATFLVTCSVFMLYDYLVERRQRLVLNTAVKSSAVVASLFPKEVHDRLYDHRTEVAGAENSRTSTLTGKTAISSTISPNQEDNATDPRAIADLYPNCTVQFCDMVGFTSWASFREPREVFKLLETAYKTFDRAASRLGVFKVETVGDCYVAATGLPLPQDDHAVVMAQFATECISKFHMVTRRLTDSLGADTADLDIRIGMHSGPVTAGVLRGAKARFQLFGDTVNVAARVESTGAPRRIHVSMSTAECLRESGRGSWLVEREDEVLAKGKGKLQTYWLSIPATEERSTTVTLHTLSDRTSSDA